MNYNQLTHELRVDHTSSDLRVLSTRSRMGEYPATHIHVKDGPDDDSPWKMDRFQGVEIVAWHREQGTVQPLYDMFAYASPDNEAWLPTETTWTKTENCECSGGASLDAVDYHHISSVSVGLDGDLLVSSRNLNTIFCFDAKGDGNLKWTLSSLAGLSDFEFERDLDRFYTPHNVIQLASDKLLLIDDGSSRPGCSSTTNLMGCWSRAAMYSLNFEKNTTTLEWQFADPHTPNMATDVAGADDGEQAKSDYYLKQVMVRDMYNYDGGSAYRLESGRILVAFTSPYDSRLWNQLYSMRAYEVDKDGEAIVYITVPHESDALESQGAYRMIPMRTVYGETDSAPFALDA
jgi:hypothetical protein